MPTPSADRDACRDRIGRFLLLGASILVVYARAPVLVLHPRFWAEEATVYFRSAYERPWAEALLTPHNGYLSLFNNIASALAANVVPLGHAPLVTTVAAFLAQLAPILVIVFGNVSLFPDLPRRAVAVLIVLVTPPSAEVWLNIINSQFYLALATCLLLLENPELPGSPGRILRRLFLGLAGLTGPVSCFLVPVFGYRAWTTSAGPLLGVQRPHGDGKPDASSQRRREAAIQFAILLACAALQAVILVSLGERSTTRERFQRPDLPTGATILTTRTLAEPLLGSVEAAQVSSAIIAYRLRSPAGGRYLGVALAAGLAAFLIFLLWKPRDPAARLAVTGYLFLATLSLVGALGENKAVLIQVSYVNGGRYFYAPAALASLLVLSAVGWGPGLFVRARSVLCGTLLASSLITNVNEFRTDLLIEPGWPDWREEVAAWRQDPSRELRVWPPGWSLTLERDRPSRLR